MAFNSASGSASSTFIVSGSPTTIVWGTCGLYSGYIVVSANEKTRVEEIDIENCAGFEAIVILLNKGYDVELNVVDDTNVTPPAIGSVIQLLNANGLAINMLVVGNNADQSRKREGLRVITAKSYTAISL